MEGPDRHDASRRMARTGGRIDVCFDIDLGELINGHHVVARGIERWLRPMPPAPPEEPGAFLHFDFVPGLKEAEEESKGFQFDIWRLTADDDKGAPYGRSGYSGCFELPVGTAVTRGYMSFGAEIPEGAARLTLRFEPAAGWTPPEPWVHKLVVDLAGAKVSEVDRR
jgi:hypothetical protein